MPFMNQKKIAIIGAGPAGLTAAYLLLKAKQQVYIFEKDKKYVGGISRTEEYKGFLFDIGGHRFFSKSQEVENFWTEILGDEMLVRPRSSKIYYKNTFFSYPLKASEALFKLGILESFYCVASYLKAKIYPIKNPINFEDWVINQFGRRLYSIFFKTYTEKVWGISCREISADWAAQRIKGLSLSSAIKNSLFKSSSKKDQIIKTLIDSFRYPKKGPGQMWETCLNKCLDMGLQIEMNSEINGLIYENKNWHIKINNKLIDNSFDVVISSAAIKDIIPNILPAIQSKTLLAANKLHYRDFITVVLIMNDEQIFSDNWIYIHESKVKVGRVQNFKSWSPFMVPDDTKACYGLEYFCFENDGLWNASDKELIALASKEFEQIGLGKVEDVIDGYVVRQAKAYPVYDKAYKENIQEIILELKNYKGLYLVGRNGMHKYNNQDHSMMTAMLAVKNILADKEIYNLWNVNQDAEYHEEGISEINKGGRLVPQAVNTEEG